MRNHKQRGSPVAVQLQLQLQSSFPASSLQHLLKIQFNLPQPQPQIQPASTSTMDLDFQLCSPVFSLQLAAQFQAPVSSTALSLPNLSLEPSEKINNIKGYYLQKMTLKIKNKK